MFFFVKNSISRLQMRFFQEIICKNDHIKKTKKKHNGATVFFWAVMEKKNFKVFFYFEDEIFLSEFKRSNSFIIKIWAEK